KKRVMEEDYLGVVSVSRPGRTFLYVVLNLLHGAVWFACLWPLLRFSWGQALVIAVGCWLATTLLVMPPLWARSREVYLQRQRDRAAAQTSANDRGEDREGPPPRVSSLPLRPRYLAATLAGKVMLTRVSSPARTLTRSVRVSALPSRTTSAFSV